MRDRNGGGQETGQNERTVPQKIDGHTPLWTPSILSDSPSINLSRRRLINYDPSCALLLVKVQASDTPSHGVRRHPLRYSPRCIFAIDGRSCSTSGRPARRARSCRVRLRNVLLDSNRESLRKGHSISTKVTNKNTKLGLVLDAPPSHHTERRRQRREETMSSEIKEGVAGIAAMDPNELRLAANGRFQANALDEALPLYSMAVEVSRQRGDADLVIHLCNRAACLYKMEMFEESRDDAEEAVKASDGANCKAYFRLARSQLALNAFGSALVTIDKATAQCDEQLALGDADGTDQLKLQKQEFEKLRALTLKKQRQHKSNPDSPPEIKSIKLEPRTPSIKEFERTTKASESYNPLGVGNFSSVVVCRHKTTGETFALKVIEKEECRKLAKRQHPNVFNEVAMERRILTQDRLPHHVNIVRAYHAMQDYGNLYFLMDLHREHKDLWSQLRYKSFSDGQYYMVGCHASLIRTYMYELLSAVEHCHKHGVVHRDLKVSGFVQLVCASPSHGFSRPDFLLLSVTRLRIYYSANAAGMSC